MLQNMQCNIVVYCYCYSSDMYNCTWPFAGIQHNFTSRVVGKGVATDLKVVGSIFCERSEQTFF